MPHQPFEAAWRTLTATFGLYGRKFGTFTALSLFPATARVAYVLKPSWMSGAVSGVVELIVALCRIALVLAALRVAWPHDLAGVQASLTQGRPFSRVSWLEVVWQVLMFSTVIYALNAGADWLVRMSVESPDLQPANRFVLKNLFIIPFATLYVLVALRTVLHL